MRERADMTLTRRLVRIGSEAGELSTSSPVRSAAVRTLFDFGACSGARAAGFAGWPTSSASRLAVAAHAEDRDDLHHRTLSHPGGVVWSTVAALACEEEASFAAAVRAASVGYEVFVRVAGALGEGHRRFWHVTSTAGVVGAAAAGAALLGLDEDGTANAVGHALSVVGGSAQALVERSRTRLIHRAHAVDTGLECARAARAGLSATRLGFEGEHGVLAAMAPVPNPSALDAPRDRTAIEETGFRLHATNGFAQSVVDAALELGSLAPDRIAGIEVDVEPGAAALASCVEPATEEQASWSIEHAVAVGVSFGNTDVLEARLIDTGSVAELRRKVLVRASGGSWRARVAIAAFDGTVVEAAVAAPLGHPDRPSIRRRPLP